MNILATELSERLGRAGDDARLRVIVGAEGDPDRESGYAFISESGHLLVAYDCGNTTRLREREVELG